MDETITKVFDELGVDKKHGGYRYLYTAVEMTVNNYRTVLDGVEKLYATLAERYGGTADSVRRAISSVIEKAWFFGDIDVLNHYFGYTVDCSRGKPTPSEFIALIADHIRVQAENDPLKKEVAIILRQFGIPANIWGYHYARTAIILSVEEPHLIGSAMAGVCDSVAKEHKSNASHVYRAIGRAIQISWSRGDEIARMQYFEDDLRPAGKEFIAVIADKLRSKLSATESQVEKYDISKEKK